MSENMRPWRDRLSPFVEQYQNCYNTFAAQAIKIEGLRREALGIAGSASDSLLGFSKEGALFSLEDGRLTVLPWFHIYLEEDSARALFEAEREAVEVVERSRGLQSRRGKSAVTVLTMLAESFDR